MTSFIERLGPISSLVCLINLVSILPTFYEQLLHQNPFAKKLQTQIVRPWKVHKELLYGKAACKILVKFDRHTIVLCTAFKCLQFGFVIFWQKDFGAKAAHKTLVKLTPGKLIVTMVTNLPMSNTHNFHQHRPYRCTLTAAPASSSHSMLSKPFQPLIFD